MTEHPPRRVRRLGQSVNGRLGASLLLWAAGTALTALLYMDDAVIGIAGPVLLIAAMGVAATVSPR